MTRFIVYYILKLIPYRKIFPTIYNMPGPVSIYFFTTKMSRDPPERLTKSEFSACGECESVTNTCKIQEMNI